MGLGDKVPSSMIIILELEGSEVEGKSKGEYPRNNFPSR